MIKRNFTLVFILCLIYAANGLSQSDTIARVKSDTLIGFRTNYSLSEAFYIPSSLEIKGFPSRRNVAFQINSSNQLITLLIDSTTSNDSFYVARYRYYADNYPDSIGRSYKTGIENKVVYISLDIPKSEENTALLPQGLNYNGSFGRGLTAGNSQSLVLNSTFNMQLGGQIGNDIGIRAVLSDANIPIQAEGTTQQLREFDQVFIELSKDEQKLVAGDFRLERPTGHFLNYSKKLKGIQYSNTDISNQIGNLSVNGSFAISGGKFSRQILDITEGNQGPYKLQGADNEQFIIVQSGTEKVYIDGELLVRGETQDYIILYDRAELQFTEKRPITKDIRVIVEFEYLAQNYARTITTANADWKLSNHEIALRLYQEGDQKNSAGLFELTAEDREFLAEVGDQASTQFQSAIFLNTDYDPSDIFYQLEISPEGDSILNYSTDPALARYQAFFTDLGSNNGSYNIAADVNTNGRVYEYVGEGNGRYSPIRKLLPPESKQMYSLSDRFNYSKNGELRAEVSLSNFDRNLFSNVDATDDLGLAGRMDWGHNLEIGSKRNHSVKLGAYAEILSTDFRFLNPYRNAEFIRDWNLDQNPERAREILAGSSISWRQKCDVCPGKQNTSLYEFSTFRRGTIYQGNRHNILSSLYFKGIQFKTNSSFLTSSSSTIATQFLRPRGSIDKRWDALQKIHTGIEYDGELNIRDDVEADSLLAISNAYDVMKAYVKTDDTKPIKASVYYSKRYDRIASEDILATYGNADNYGSSLEWQGKTQSVNFTVNYRRLQVDQNLRSDVKGAENLLGGLDYQYSLWNGIVRGVSNFNFNTGQEPQREFDYREVAPGEGNFIWLDDGDGVQEKNEFQPAPFSDQGNFIQVSLFNNEFIQVYQQDYLQTLRIEPITWKISKVKWKKVLSPLSSQTSWKLSRKDLQDDGLPTFEFFGIDDQNPQLVSFLSSVNQNLFWNRGNPAYDIHLNYLLNNSSILLTTGNEIRNDEQISLRGRINIQKKADIELEIASKNRGNRNVNFPNNDFYISGWESTIGLEYRLKQNLQYRFTSSYGGKNNLLGNEQAQFIDLETSAGYAGKSKFRIDASLRYNRILYQSSDNPTIELIMLEGLRNGNNFLWELRFTKRLINNFDLSINYNGRKTPDIRTVHVGSAQIRATF